MPDSWLKRIGGTARRTKHFEICPKIKMCADHISPGHQKSEAEHRQDICTAGNWLYERGFIPACDGNITVRLDSNRILATPRGFCKGMMAPDDLVITDLDGRKLSGNARTFFRTRHASFDLQAPLRRERCLPRASANRHRIRRGGSSAR